jgi:hypothetical protein
LQWRNRANVCGTIVWLGPHEFRDEGKQDLRMANPFFENPILNSPYLCPARHWELDEQGQPTQKIIASRRRAEFITPIPKPRKRRRSVAQESFVFDEGKGLSTREQQYDPTSIINEVRGHVNRWRVWPKPSEWQVTPETARLLEHWRHHEFAGVRPFFCQVEAVETAIWLTEVAPQSKSGKQILDNLAAANNDANPELFRLALKLATGAGKTTVMAMLIAWQTINAVRRPGSKHFIRGDMPKKGRGRGGELDPLKLPTRLQTAMQALYGHYEKTFRLWEDAGISVPPCFIIVCQNTAISKLVYDYISGFHRKNEDGTTTLENGRLALFRNFDGSESRMYRPDFIVLVDDGRGDDDPLHLVVEIKGYRREDAKEKKSTMETYWVPGVNNLKTYGRWAFAEFTEIYQIEADFKARVEGEFNRMIMQLMNPTGSNLAETGA